MGLKSNEKCSSRANLQNSSTSHSQETFNISMQPLSFPAVIFVYKKSKYLLYPCFSPIGYLMHTCLHKLVFTSLWFEDVPTQNKTHAVCHFFYNPIWISYADCLTMSQWKSLCTVLSYSQREKKIIRSTSRLWQTLKLLVCDEFSSVEWKQHLLCMFSISISHKG